MEPSNGPYNILLPQLSSFHSPHPFHATHVRSEKVSSDQRADNSNFIVAIDFYDVLFPIIGN